MAVINVLSIQRLSTEDRAKIEAIDPMIQFTDAGGWYDGEIRKTWPAFTSARYLAPNAMGSGTREERDRLLANAEVILGGWPQGITRRNGVCQSRSRIVTLAWPPPSHIVWRP